MYYFNQYNCNLNCEKNVSINSFAQEAVANLELCKNDCKKSGILYGKVINQFGHPLKDAIVKVVSETYEPIQIAKTDCLGSYSIDKIPTNQPCKVIATAENYSLNDGIKICLSEREVLELDVTLHHRNCVNEGIVTGTVLNKLNSLPINNVRVALYEESCGAERFRKITDTNEFGQFVLTRLSPGAYLVKLCMHGYINGQYRVHITKCGQIVDRVISLCPTNLAWKGTVSGVITDSSQVPIADADVILFRVENSGETTPIAYTKTNHNGVYLFINVEIGTYKVCAK